MSKPRESWGSRIGFIMAAAGSAIGLGNIWRFPYLAGQNGGSAFIIIYLLSSILIGLTIMIAEFTLGRRSAMSAVSAVRGVNKRWTFVGVIGVLTSFLILGFYPVVGGWALAYMFKSLSGLMSATDFGEVFGNFIVSYEPLIWLAIYMIFNIGIVIKGVSKGIETASKVLMPMLFGLFVILCYRSVTLPNSHIGLEFLFLPDWSKVTGETVLAAIGQSFFSLSLGMGVMITYGSYLSKKENLSQNAAYVTIFDTCIAIMAGVAIFPALFSYGLEPAAGPGLVFIVVPQIFAEMGILGVVLSTIFFLALFIAALTSSVSLLEVVVAYLIDDRKVERRTATITASTIIIVMSAISSLSMGVLSHIKIFDVVFFDFLDILTDKVFLTLGGLFIAIIVGYTMKKDDLKQELTSDGLHKFKLFNVWYFLIRFVVPIAITSIAITGMLSIKATGVLVFGLILVGLLALFSKKL